MSAEIIQFPCRKKPSEQKKYAFKKDHLPNLLKKVTRKMYMVFHIVLILGWKLWAFLLTLLTVWEGGMALVCHDKPHTHYGLKFLLVLIIFFSLSGIRFIKPRDTAY